MDANVNDIIKGNKPVQTLCEWVPHEMELSEQDLVDLMSVCLTKAGKDNTKRKTNEQKQYKFFTISPIVPKKKGEKLEASATRRYNVLAKNVVGVVELTNRVLVIQPKMKVENILFLLSYGWHMQDWRESLKVISETDKTPEALIFAIAWSFVFKVSKILQRGVLQGYTSVDDCLTTIRGKVRWNDQITQRFGSMAPIEVTYEEFTEDIEENRLIKAAVFALQKTRNLPSELRLKLRSIDNQLDSVTLIKNYDPKHLPSIYYTPLNDYYRPAVELAKFVLRNFSWTLQKGSFEAPAFLLYMPKVFEDFVVNSLRETKALRHLNPNEHNFPQNKELLFDSDNKMYVKPDISFWESGTCSFVGDCKYKNLFKKKKRKHDEDEETNKMSDLYQLVGYTTAAGVSSGLLIYAAETDVKPGAVKDVRPTNSKVVVKRRAISLNLEPTGILQQMEAIGEEIAGMIEVERSKRKEQNKH